MLIFFIVCLFLSINIVPLSSVNFVVIVQLLSHVQLFATTWTSGFPVLHDLPEFAQVHVHRVSDAV